MHSQAGIISQFDELFVETNRIELGTSFSDLIYQIKVYPPTEDFAENYIATASKFLTAVKTFRQEQITIKN